MTYTLWSHGELLGESALDYVRVIPKLRTGDLHLTEKGLIVFDRIAQTHADAYYSARRFNRANGADDELEKKTLHADLAAEEDQYAALALELRAPNGSVIGTEGIHVTDTEYLLNIDRERQDEDESLEESGTEDDLDFDSALEDLAEEFEADHPPWASEGPERPPARFQLYVTLTDEWAIP